MKKSSIEANASYLKAVELATAFQPKADVDYRWVYDYSLSILKEMRSAVLNLESKAHKIIELLAPLIGLTISASAILIGKKIGLNGATKITILLSLAALGVAVILAFLSLLPKSWTYGPDIRTTVDMAPRYPKDTSKALGHQSMVIATSVQWLLILMDEKGKFLRASYWSLFVALLFAASSVVCVLGTL
ncbi:MAG: hypothetical protein WAU88_04520 [Candidatus Zixiibacteriota bacterium]